MNYIDTLNDEIKEYYKILCKDFPEFLYDYINTKEMLRIAGTGCDCGTHWTNIFHNKFYYSNLAHSIGVALIVWNFTKDKKQTLAGLFHDIASPAFKHCIDFMNGDYKTQESTEEQTREIIENSKEIMSLLKRDNITIEEVMDYHIYPIADNDTPRLSADRLDYTFMNGVSFKPVWDLSTVEELYNDIEILENEDGIQELGFKTKEIAEKFIDRASKIWPHWICNEDKLVMQFWADSVRKMKENNLLTMEDLYIYSEKEIIDKMLNCGIPEIEQGVKKFQKTEKVYHSEEPVQDKYCISIESKRRYIIPLVKVGNNAERIDKISNIAREQIHEYLNYRTAKYAYLDFNY